MEKLKKTLLDIVLKEPNDQELGKKIRNAVYEYNKNKKQAKSIFNPKK